MKTSRKLLATTTLTLLFTFGLAGVSWSTVETFTFEASGFARPGTVQPGDTLTLTTVDVDPGLVGLVCTFTGTTTNGESVHVNNYAEIVTNGNQSDIRGTEDGVNGIHIVDRTLELGPTITVLYHVGGRAVGELPVGVSVDMEFTVTCTTTTTSTTSTTTPSTTSTSTPSTSTTTSPPTSPPPTSAPPATTTTVPTTSSTIPPVTTQPSTPDSTLPFTGPEDVLWGGIGAIVLATGALALYATRSRGGRHEA